MGYTIETVPTHVPPSKAAQWIKVWETVYQSALDDGDKSRDECEARAYDAANSILSNRSNGLTVGDDVIWANDKSVRQRGRVLSFPMPEPAKPEDGEALGIEDAEPLVEVEPYKPVRDGWEPTGKRVNLKITDCTKVEQLYAPSRISRKDAADEEDDEDAVKALIEDVVKATRDLAPSADPTAIKRLGPDRIGGYALVHGNAEARDVEGDYFTKATDLWMDVYQNQPVLFDHATGVKIPDDPDLPTDDQDTPRRYKIGHIVKAMRDDTGLWIEAVVDAHNKWVRGVWELIDKGVLHYSSGSVPHLIKRSEDGEVKSWPIIEVSLTPTPAEPRKTLVQNLSPAAVRTAGIEASGGDSPETPSPSAAAGQLIPSAAWVKSNQRRKITMDAKTRRRLGHLLDVYWDGNLAAAASAYKAARRATTKQGENPEDSEVVSDAGSQLDQLVAPIAEQAKSALGLEPGDVKALLFKMALERARKQDIPGEDEDFLEEGELPEVPEDIAAEGALPGEDEDFLQQAPGEFGPDEAPLDDYLEEGELPDETEPEQTPMMLSARPRAHRNADPIDALVRREMARMSQPRGRFATKGAPMIITREPAITLGQFIKASKERDYGILRRMQEKAASHYKALGINPDTSGGFLVPPEQSDQIIELLRAKSLFLRTEGDAGSGAGESIITVLPLNSDTLLIPKQTGQASANWIGENAQITASEETFGQIQLIAKKLAVLVKVSNELLQDASPDVDNFIRGDMSRAMSLAVDDAVLYGGGINGAPLGIDNFPDISKTALNAAPTYDNLVTLVDTVEEANVEEDDSWRWLLHPRDKNVFRRLKDGAGQYIFAGNALEAAEGGVPQQLLGYNWMKSTRVDKQGTGVTAETDVFFGRWRDVIMGMRKTIEIVASDVAGTSFEYNQTWIRAILRLDISLRHAESIAMLTDVREVVSA